MKHKLIVLILNVFFLNCFSQNGIVNVAFVTDACIDNFKPDTLGRISFQTNCRGENYSEINGYMIHKNGGSWWYKEAKRRFPNNVMNCEYKLAKKLLSEDKDSLKNYNKWVFFVDKKFLEPVVQVHGETGVEETAYYIKETIPFEEILYQRLVGKIMWVEIGRKKFDSYSQYRKSTWRIDFIKAKLAESNHR